MTLHASGREAMRVAFRALAERSGRREVALPAYVCFSVPAAAVAAGLSVRLVDVDESGRLDAESLARLPLENVAAVVVANLFGLAEPVRDVLAIAQSAGVAVVDDAAQALGARSAEGPAGARGEVGVLSFGRAKPLSALGGGALAWTSAPPARARACPVAAHPLGAAVRALAYDAARWPPLLGLLARIPALGIGETVYDPDFAQGAISGPALSLARALLPELIADSAAAHRRRAGAGRGAAQRHALSARSSPRRAPAPCIRAWGWWRRAPRPAQPRCLRCGRSGRLRSIPRRWPGSSRCTATSWEVRIAPVPSFLQPGSSRYLRTQKRAREPA